MDGDIKENRCHIFFETPCRKMETENLKKENGKRKVKIGKWK